MARDGIKTGGRKKGVPNKDVKEKRDRVERVLAILDKTIDEDLAAMAPGERAKVYVSLQEYQIPKLARTEHTGRVVTENYNVNLTPAEMKKIAKTLQNEC